MSLWPFTPREKCYWRHAGMRECVCEQLNTSQLYGLDQVIRYRLAQTTGYTQGVGPLQCTHSISVLLCRFPDPRDPPSVVAARAKERQTIQNWIKSWSTLLHYEVHWTLASLNWLACLDFDLNMTTGHTYSYFLISWYEVFTGEEGDYLHRAICVKGGGSTSPAPDWLPQERMQDKCC